MKSFWDSYWDILRILLIGSFIASLVLILIVPAEKEYREAIVSDCNSVNGFQVAISQKELIPFYKDYLKNSENAKFWNQEIQSKFFVDTMRLKIGAHIHVIELYSDSTITVIQYQSSWTGGRKEKLFVASSLLISDGVD